MKVFKVSMFVRLGAQVYIVAAKDLESAKDIAIKHASHNGVYSEVASCRCIESLQYNGTKECIIQDFGFNY